MAEDETNEQRWIDGHRAAWRTVLRSAIGELRGAGAKIEKDPELRAAALLSQLEEARVVLRRLCEDHGDNSWSDELSLRDVIDKHLAIYLYEGEVLPPWADYEIDTDDVCKHDDFDGVCLMTGELRAASGLRMTRETAQKLANRLNAFLHPHDVAPFCNNPLHGFNVVIDNPLRGPKTVRIEAAGQLVHSCVHPYQAPESPCPECKGTGLVDSDGVGALGYIVKRDCPRGCNDSEVMKVVRQAERDIQEFFHRLLATTEPREIDPICRRLSFKIHERCLALKIEERRLMYDAKPFVMLAGGDLQDLKTASHEELNALVRGVTTRDVYRMAHQVSDTMASDGITCDQIVNVSGYAGKTCEMLSASFEAAQLGESVLVAHADKSRDVVMISAARYRELLAKDVKDV